MIDIHSHILPDIDDGASSVSEAMELIHALINEGIRVILCTPHYDPSRETIEEFEEKRNKAYRSVHVEGVQLIQASETYLHPNLLRYPDVAELCVKNTRYLLLEMPFTKRWDQSQYRLVEQLITTHNIIPIIAHIERYPATKFGTKPIKKLMKMGCVIQLNTGTLQKNEMRKKALRLIKKGYIDVLGTDCHNMKNRKPVYRSVRELIIEEFGHGIMNQLTENASAITHGKLLYRLKEIEQQSLSYSDFK